MIAPDTVVPLGGAGLPSWRLTVGRRLVFVIIRWVNDAFVSDFAVVTAILLIMCAMALITDLIGRPVAFARK